MMKSLLKSFWNFKSKDAPVDSVPVGPVINGVPYMYVWKEENKINLVFRNMPQYTISFSKEVLSDLIEALEKIKG